MATIGTVIAKFGADISGFQSDMGRAAKISQQKSAQMKQHMVGAAKAIAAGAAVAGAAVTKMVRDSLRDADRFQKLSIAIGASTEALSQLEFAAQQSGADFESVAKGMSKLQKSIGDANNGLATQTRAFEKLGVSTEELTKLKPEKQFEVIGDALKSVTNATERTSIAADIFGQRISVGLMPLLLQGSAGIQGLRMEADKLGLTLTENAANGAAEFNDKMNTLKMFMTGFGRQVTTTLIPTLISLFDKIVSLGDASEFAAGTGEFLSNILKVLVSAGIILKNVFEAASKILVAFAVTVTNVFKALISPITSFVNRVSQAFEELSQGNFKKAAQAMGNIVGDVKKQFVDAGNEIAFAAKDLVGGAIGDLKEGFEGVMEVWDDTERSAETVLKPALQNTVVDAAGEATDAIEEMVAATDDIDAAFEEVTVSAKSWAEEHPRAMAKVEESTVGVAAVIENSFKRLDDTFQSFWTELVKNGKLSLKSIKDLFLDTIAQMLHAAITQPIVLRIGAAFTGGITGTAQAAGGSIFSGGGGLLSGAGGLLGGGLGTLLGALGAGALGAFTGIGIGGNGTSQSTVGGLLGAGGLGTLGYGFGAVLGGPIGAIVGAGLGALVGGILGSLVGGLFGDSTPRISAGGMLGNGLKKNGSNSEFTDTLLGGFYIGNSNGGRGREFKDAAIEAFTQLDNAIAAFVNDDQLGKITDALKNWNVTLEGNAATVENLLGSRFKTILGAFGQNVQDYVNSFDGLEAQAEALQRFVIALNTVGATISAFIESDPASMLADSLDEAQKTSTIRLQELGSNLTDLFASFDGTPEMLDQISQAVDARYRGEMEYLIAIDNLVKSIGQSIADQQTRIREAVQGPQSFEELMQQANDLFGMIGSAGSPEELAQIVAQIQSLVDKAFGGLDEAGKAINSDTLISFLDTVQAAAEERANALAQMVIDEGVLLREQALSFAETIGAPLELNTQAVDGVTDAVNNQTQEIGSRIDDTNARLDDLIRTIRDNNDFSFVRGA